MFLWTLFKQWCKVVSVVLPVFTFFKSLLMFLWSGTCDPPFDL